MQISRLLEPKRCDEFDTQVAATEMTILEEISIKDLSKITEWWKNDNVLDLLYWSDGFAVVQRTNGESCKIDKNGKIVSK